MSSDGHRRCTPPQANCWTASALIGKPGARNEELDRYGAPPASPFIARHELMDTPDKLRTLLGDTGYRDVWAEIVPWSHRPSPADFIARHTVLGTTGRRLAAMDSATQTAFLRRVRSQLEKLATEDFFDESEVIAATAFAP